MSTFILDRLKLDTLGASTLSEAKQSDQAVASERQTLTASMEARISNPPKYVDPKLLSQVMPRSLGAAAQPMPNEEQQSEGRAEGTGGGHSQVHPRSYQDGQAIAAVSSVMGLAGGQADESPARRHEQAQPDASAPDVPSRERPQPSMERPRSLGEAASRQAGLTPDASDPFANIKPTTQMRRPIDDIFDNFASQLKAGTQADEARVEVPTPEAPARRRPRM